MHVPNYIQHSKGFAFTSNITAPRATHFAILQFSFKKLYIMSKFPVLSTGMTCNAKLNSIRKKIMRHSRDRIYSVLTSFQLWLKKMKPPAPSSTSMNRIMRNEYYSRCQRKHGMQPQKISYLLMV